MTNIEDVLITVGLLPWLCTHRGRQGRELVSREKERM
jgi:hypothetical protein